MFVFKILTFFILMSLGSVISGVILKLFLKISPSIELRLTIKLILACLLWALVCWLFDKFTKKSSKNAEIIAEFKQLCEELKQMPAKERYHNASAILANAIKQIPCEELTAKNLEYVIETIEVWDSKCKKAYLPFKKRNQMRSELRAKMNLPENPKILLQEDFNLNEQLSMLDDSGAITLFNELSEHENCIYEVSVEDIDQHYFHDIEDEEDENFGEIVGEHPEFVQVRVVDGPYPIPNTLECQELLGQLAEQVFDCPNGELLLSDMGDSDSEDCIRIKIKPGRYLVSAYFFQGTICFILCRKDSKFERV